MISPEGDDEEFEFYLKLAKPLVLNLPNTNDRIKAAAWVRYLRNENATDIALRGEYLKLLLFVLQRRTLYGPFATVPDESRPLEEFPKGINIQDVAKSFTEIDRQLLRAKLKKQHQGEWPPYSTACSSDLTEYAAHQEIPEFGVQAYYALSRDPVYYWNRVENAILPIEDSVDISDQKYYITNTTTPDISCFVSPQQDYPRTSLSAGRGSRVPYKKPPVGNGFEDVAPKVIKAPSPAPQPQDEYNFGSRVPPNWGSNLFTVKDSTPTCYLSPSSFTVSDFEMEATEQDIIEFFNDDISLYADESRSDTSGCWQ